MQTLQTNFAKFAFFVDFALYSFANFVFFAKFASANFTNNTN